MLNCQEPFHDPHKTDAGEEDTVGSIYVEHQTALVVTWSAQGLEEIGV
jgi:hypothetical protein